MTNFNLYSEKVGAGIAASLVSYFIDNLMPLFISVLVFEVFDFVTGVWKSAVVAKRNKRRFAFESVKAWRTIYKVVLIFLGILMAEMLDVIISDHDLRLANYFTAFVCGVEFWSFLENAAVISNHPIFKWLKKYMKEKVEDKIDFDDIMEDDKKKDGKKK